MARVVLCLLVLTPLPVAAGKKGDGAPKEGKPPKGARIYGKLRGADGKSPLAGAIVHAYHLAGEGTFSSQPTPANGSFEIAGLPFGHFDLVVETEQGVFVSSEVVAVPPSGKTFVQLTIQRYEDRPDVWWDSHGRRPLPAGAGGDAVGIADIIRKSGSTSFWKSPKGVLIIAGAGTAVLLAVAASSDPEEEPIASPSTP